MNTPLPGDSASTQSAQEQLLKQMLEEQIALGESIAATSKFLRFVLSLANENLSTIKQQLETIRDLASAIDKTDCA